MNEEEVLNLVSQAELHIRNARTEIFETGRALDRIREGILK